MTKRLYPAPANGYYSLLAADRRESQYNIFKSLYVLLQGVDLAMTLMAAYLGYAELNPFIHSLLASPLHLVLIKLVIPLAIVLVLPGKYLVPAVGLQSLIIGWNIKELILLML
jgi:hypothetical protein